MSVFLPPKLICCHSNVPWATEKTNVRLIIHIHVSINDKNLAKIDLVNCEIFDDK